MHKQFEQTLDSLRTDIRTRYNELTKGKSFDFTLKALSNYSEEEQTDITTILANENMIDLYEYDFYDFLNNIFHNDNHGKEKESYLLRIDENGIYVIGADDSTPEYISFSDISSTIGEIEIIEYLESC